MNGRVYGIGVGPGDPELITVRGAHLLSACPVIAYPAPLDGDSMARAIAAPHIPDGRTEIAIAMPLSTDRFPMREVYRRAGAAILGHTGAGRDVAVLCEGDPFFYGSFLYLFGWLAGAGASVSVVPGVSSLTACAAMLARPLAARSDVLSVIPALLPEADIAARLADADAGAIIKLGRHFPKVARVINDLGLGDRAFYIERATLANQRILPLDAIDGEKVPYFSMILVHQRRQVWE